MRVVCGSRKFGIIVSWWFVGTLSWADSSSERLTSPLLVQFRAHPFAQNPNKSSYHRCRASLLQAGLHLRSLTLVEEARKKRRASCQIEAYSTHSLRSEKTGKRLVCQLTGWGWSEPNAQDNEDPFWMNNAEIVNFGLVPDGFDLKGALANWNRLRVEDEKAWKNHVRDSLAPLRATLNELGIRARVEQDVDFFNKPCLSVRFDHYTDDYSELGPVFSNFRGIKVKLGQYNFSREDADRRERREPPSGLMLRLLQSIENDSRYPGRRVPQRQSQISYTSEGFPNREEVDLVRLGPDLHREVSLRLSGTVQGWSKHYAIRVKVESAEVADSLGLTRLMMTSTYSANWSLDQIARATVHAGVISIFTDSAANRARQD